MKATRTLIQYEAKIGLKPKVEVNALTLRLIARQTRTSTNVEASPSHDSHSSYFWTNEAIPSHITVNVLIRRLHNTITNGQYKSNEIIVLNITSDSS